MTDIIIIAAVANNGVIGKKNDIPWRISEDFKRFKSLTLGYPCIMGDSTYESLPSRPLPGRENIVLTLNKEYNPPGVTLFHDFNKAVDYVNNKPIQKAFIIGGATIYRLGIAVADYMFLTRIHNDFDGDVRFPDYNKEEWETTEVENNEVMDRISNSLVSISYETLRRRKV